MVGRGDSLYFPMMIRDEEGERLVFFSDLAVPIFEKYLKVAGWDGERWHPPFITLDLRGKTTRAIVRTRTQRVFVVVAFSEIENGQEFGISLLEFLKGKAHKKGEVIHLDNNELVVIEVERGEEEI